MHRRHQKIAGATSAIAGKDAARPVRAMRRRRQSENQHTGVRITKAGNRLRPIRLVAKCRSFGPRDLGAVVTESHTRRAGNDVLVNVGERRWMPRAQSLKPEAYFFFGL